MVYDGAFIAKAFPALLPLPSWRAAKVKVTKNWSQSCCRQMAREVKGIIWLNLVEWRFKQKHISIHFFFFSLFILPSKAGEKVSNIYNWWGFSFNIQGSEQKRSLSQSQFLQVLKIDLAVVILAVFVVRKKMYCKEKKYKNWCSKKWWRRKEGKLRNKLSGLYHRKH